MTSLNKLEESEIENYIREASGGPGEPPRWAQGKKAAVGTSAASASQVWFTISQGILNEIYFPRVDSPCSRERYFIVKGKDGFFSKEKSDCEHKLEWLRKGVPGFKIANSCRNEKYIIEKTIICDDQLSVVLQKCRFKALSGNNSDYRLYVFIDPNVAGRGAANNSWISKFKGQTSLFAERDTITLSVQCSSGFKNASAGFAGTSDGISDLKNFGQLKHFFSRAQDGNVTLIAEIDLSSSAEFTLTFGMGFGAGEAAHNALGGLKKNFNTLTQSYISHWKKWQDALQDLDLEGGEHNLYRLSAAMLKAHSNKSIPGAVASLAVPWGDHRGDEDLLQGAYHLVWPRDLVQHGTAFIAAGAREEAIDILHYLQIVQEPDGHWPQNMWVSGEAFWNGIQLDQAAQPILLADLAWREGCLDETSRKDFWPMVKAACGFIVRNGPYSEQDRWEEQSGYSVHSLAVAISALLVGAEWSKLSNEPEVAQYLIETADSWNACIEGWLYVKGTETAKRWGIVGYYSRTMSAENIEVPVPGQTEAALKSKDKRDQDQPDHEIISTDALSLVRFGLRSVDDPRIINTVKAIDSVLKLETEKGSVWHRYSSDRFGEHDDGKPFNVYDKGRGRAWPLLIAERAHYEIQAGNKKFAQKLLNDMENYAGSSGMIPEQVWDSEDIPEKDLFKGYASGAACPLLWGHSEYLKCLRSLREEKIFDMPVQSYVRYVKGKEQNAFAIWRMDHPLKKVSREMDLRIECNTDKKLSIRLDNTEFITDDKSFFGMRVIDIPAASLAKSSNVLIEIRGHETYQVEIT